MSLFALVHGAWHGAWCWDRLVPELEARGHRTAALDLPIAGGATETYVDPVVSMIEESRDDDDVVLVGHSMAGLTIPHVARRTPVKRLVYLAALMPKPDKTITETFREETDCVNEQIFAGTIDNGDGTSSWRPDAAIEWFYHDCSPQDAAWAASKLRPQYQGPGNDPPPVDLRRVASAYIVCSADRAVSPHWGRRRAKDWLGVDAIELDASHSPFLSCPAELAALLDTLA